jgi:hypothetical protein
MSWLCPWCHVISSIWHFVNIWVAILFSAILKAAKGPHNVLAHGGAMSFHQYGILSTWSFCQYTNNHTAHTKSYQVLCKMPWVCLWYNVIFSMRHFPLGHLVYVRIAFVFWQNFQAPFRIRKMYLLVCTRFMSKNVANMRLLSYFIKLFFSNHLKNTQVSPNLAPTIDSANLDIII